MFGLPMLLAAALATSQTQDSKNPLFDELIAKGVAVAPDKFVPLPPPILADGLGAKEQLAAIRDFAGGPIDEMLRDALVAKHVHKITPVKPSDPQAPAFRLDLGFVAYGNLDALQGKDPQTVFFMGRKDTKIKALKAADLASRKTKLLGSDPAKEGFSHLTYTLFDEVQISITMHTLVSATKDSYLIARRVDPAFAGDADFPNQWRRLGEDGKAGVASPYGGFAQYMKITRLAEPKGALFVEYHQVFTEPKGWFDGQNVLRTKLPLLVQTEVRAFRRELKN